MFPEQKPKVGRRAFSFAAPQVWNEIPLNIRTSSSLSCYKQHLKTHYFTIPFHEIPTHLATAGTSGLFLTLVCELIYYITLHDAKTTQCTATFSLSGCQFHYFYYKHEHLSHA